MAHDLRSVVAPMVLYLSTGVLSTATQQVLVYSGASGGLLIPFFTFLGMVRAVTRSPVRPWRSAWDDQTHTRGMPPDWVVSVPGRGAVARERQRCPPSALHLLVVAPGSRGRPAGLVDLEPGQQPELCFSHECRPRRALGGRTHGARRTEGVGRFCSVVVASNHPLPRYAPPPRARARCTRAPLCVSALAQPQSPRPVSLAPIEAFLARHLTLTRAVALSIAFEISGFSVSMAGLRLAGSGIYQVVHASVVVFSALLSWLVRRKVLNRGQWGGILLVTVGLAVSALGEHTHTSSAGEVVTGVLLTLFGSIIYAGNYTLLEVCSHALESPSPRVLAPRIGTGAATALALYVCIFTLPSWDSVYAAPVAKAGGASSSILAGYVVITVSSLAHSVSYFGLLGRVGAVSVGVLQSLRAVAVFLLSAVLFCASQESQCLSLERSVACVTVAGGVILYAYSKAESGVASPASSASATDLPSAEAEKLKVTSLGPASSRSARDPDDTL